MSSRVLSHVLSQNSALSQNIEVAAVVRVLSRFGFYRVSGITAVVRVLSWFGFYHVSGITAVRIISRLRCC